MIHPRIQARIEKMKQQRSRALSTACIQTLAGLHEISLVLSLVNPAQGSVAKWRLECAVIIEQLARLSTEDEPDLAAIDTVAVRLARFLDDLTGVYPPASEEQPEEKPSDDSSVVYLTDAAQALGRVALMTSDPLVRALSARSFDAANDLRALLQTPSADVVTLDTIRRSIAELGGAVEALHQRAIADGTDPADD